MARTTRTVGARKSIKSNSGLPGWIAAWLLITAVIQTWDASYILLRPHSAAGGKLNAFWRPYNLYQEIDLRYKEDESFGIAQSCLNVVEVLLCVFVLYLNRVGSKFTYVLALFVNTMTWWKTVLYMLMYTDFCNGNDMIGTSDPLLLIFCFFIPNGFWILVPGMSIISLGKRLASKVDRNERNYDD
ncbi:uncharacterized protein [Antedon mediterranea]|uniref:uncharacterized protein n=1 Tax=Antedon mediterranea TaxID=105859 RepID=UPI003AF5F7E3